MKGGGGSLKKTNFSNYQKQDCKTQNGENVNLMFCCQARGRCQKGQRSPFPVSAPPPSTSLH